MNWGLLTGPDRLVLEDGCQLRLLSAFEVLQARAQARDLAGEEREMALCANACLLAKAVLRDEKAKFRNGEEVLNQLTVEQINRLAKLWMEFNRQVNPGLGVEEGEADKLKKAWSTRLMSALSGACSVPSACCPPRRRRGK